MSTQINLKENSQILSLSFQAGIVFMMVMLVLLIPFLVTAEFNTCGSRQELKASRFWIDVNSRPRILNKVTQLTPKNSNPPL